MYLRTYWLLSRLNGVRMSVCTRGGGFFVDTGKNQKISSKSNHLMRIISVLKGGRAMSSRRGRWLIRSLAYC